MFSSVRNFLSRHKRKFIVTGVLVGGAALALQFAQRKLRQYQEDQAREFIERQRRTQHFEMTERTCNQTIMGVAAPLCNEICKNLDTQPMLDKLREKPDNKQELWHEMKVIAFTRLATMVYACSMLVVSLRVQMNLLGGYMYKESMNGQNKLTSSMQETYLSLSHHFIVDGVAAMAKLIESKVRSIMKSYELTQELSLADVEQIFYSIQRAVNSDESDPSNSMAKYVLPKQIEEDGGSEMLAQLFAETLDMLESEDAVSLNTYNVTRGFSIVMDSIAESYYEPLNRKTNGLTNALATAPMTNGGGNVVDITDLCKNTNAPITKSDLNVATNINHVKLPLAKIIPIVNGLSNKEFSATVKPPSLSTSLVTLFLVSDKIKALGANVYEVFSQ